MLLYILTWLVFLMPALTFFPVPSFIVISALLPTLVLARYSPTVRFYWRVAAYAGGLGLVSAWGVTLSIVMSIAGMRDNINYVVARSFYYFVGPVVGVKFRVEGEEILQMDRPYVMVGNHQSMLDVLYLGAVFPKSCSVMAKRELRYAPLLGQYMSLSNAVFVDRASRSDAVKTFAKVAHEMKEKKTSIFIFVEGTRTSSPNPTLLPFKKGAFHLAVQGQVPIVPVVCENYWKAFSTKRKNFEGGEVVIKVLPPIPSKGFTSSSEDIAVLAEKTRNAMLDSLEELAKRPGSTSGSTIVERDPKRALEIRKKQ